MTLKRTPEEWHKLVEKYHDSGKSLREFCSEHGFAPSTFRHHLDKKKAKSKQKLSFIPLPKTVDSLKYQEINLELPSGIRLSIKG